MPANYGNVLPIRIPELNDQANIVTALTDFYYGLNSEGNQIVGANTTTSELMGATYSIAGNLQRLFTNKANYTDNLGVFADTTSAQLLSTLTDATGTGVAVFSIGPTLVTPTLGVATATSINGTTIPTSKTLVTTADTGTVTNTMLNGSIANSKLANSTISGVSLGSNLNSLSAGTGLTLTGGYNGSANKTIAIDSSVVTTTDTPNDGDVLTFRTANNAFTWEAVSTLPGKIENAVNADYATTAGSATTATTATNAVNTGITNDITTNATVYPTWVTATTGNLPTKTSSTKLSFNPSTGTLTATAFVGTFSGLTLGQSTTAFTLTGGTTTAKTLTVSESIVLTSSDSANSRTLNIGLGGTLGSAAFTASTDYISSSASKTGTGNLVYATGPSLTAPSLGAATATTINGTQIPTSKTLVTTDSTATIAAPTTGNAASATNAQKGARSSSTGYQQIFVSQADPTTYATVSVNDIWMW